MDTLSTRQHEDGYLLEIKCPYTAKDMSISDAVGKKVVKFLKHGDQDGALYLVPGSEYYYQVRESVTYAIEIRIKYLVF
jgi:hypothetical protein